MMDFVTEERHLRTPLFPHLSRLLYRTRGVVSSTSPSPLSRLLGKRIVPTQKSKHTHSAEFADTACTGFCGRIVPRAEDNIEQEGVDKGAETIVVADSRALMAALLARKTRLLPSTPAVFRQKRERRRQVCPTRYTMRYPTSTTFPTPRPLERSCIASRPRLFQLQLQHADPLVLAPRLPARAAATDLQGIHLPRQRIQLLALCQDCHVLCLEHGLDVLQV